MPGTINRQTLSEQIYQVLRNDILTREIACGQKLTLQSLKERFKVSHTPIREALTRLSEDGLVSYYSNVGVNVIKFTEKDIREIFSFMGALDGLAVKACLSSSKVDDLIYDLEDICDSSEKALGRKRMSDWHKFSDEFHLTFYKYADNNRLDQAAAKIRAQLTLLSNIYQHPDNASDINQEHLNILDAIKKHDVVLAMDLISQHHQHDLELALAKCL